MNKTQIKQFVKLCMPFGLLRMIEEKPDTEIAYIRRVLARLDVVVDTNRKQTINVFLPAMHPQLSAGPLSILYLALFLYNHKLNVRLIIYPKIQPEETLRKLIRSQSSEFAEFAKHIEILNLDLTAHKKIAISPHDVCVATHWSSAFYADQIQQHAQKKQFIYFIQDDERSFFPNGSMHALIEHTYLLDFYPFFSTDSLQNYFLEDGNFSANPHHKRCISQKSPASYFLPEKSIFLKRAAKKRFVFYARPTHRRNCYELCLYVIAEAIRRKILTDDWDIMGIGYGRETTINIGDNRSITMLPQYSLDEYKKLLYTFDVALSLMETPHISMPPVDFALSGCLVVTNTYRTKTTEEIARISSNIVSAPLAPAALIAALGEAVKRSDNIEERYSNAVNANHPTGIAIFNSEHQKWIETILNENLSPHGIPTS